MTSSNKKESALGFGPRGANKMDFSGKEKDKLFLSAEGKKFVDVSYLAGIDSPQDGRVFVTADLNHDGAEELIVMFRNAPMLRIYERTGWNPGTQWLGLDVEDGVNATATAKCGGRSVMRMQNVGTGFGSQNSRVITFGLGKCQNVEELRVRWLTPQGIRERVFENKPAREMFKVSLEGPLKHVPGYYAKKDAPAIAAKEANASGKELLSLMRTGTVHGPKGEMGGWRPKRDLVYVDLWASWCAACKRSGPALDALASRFGGRMDFVGVTIDANDDTAKVAEWAKSVSEKAPVLSFESDAHARVIDSALGLFGGRKPALPTALVIDRNTGEVLMRNAGVPTASELEALFSKRQVARR